MREMRGCEKIPITINHFKFNKDFGEINIRKFHECLQVTEYLFLAFSGANPEERTPVL
jgi:hypothetical protein